MSAKNKNLPYVVQGNEFRFIKLLDSNGIFHNDILLSAAIDMAKQKNLDVVCFKNSTQENLPFCKIIDFGKWKYTEDKRKKKQNKEHKKTTKEVRISLDIADHDLEHKIKQAKDFLTRGDDVVFSMFLKGRQKYRFDEAIEKIENIKDICSDCGTESARKCVVPNITLRLSPLTNKK